MNTASLDQYEAVFSALADPQRRTVLITLARDGEASASSLAAGMPITRQAVVKHLTSLDRARLVSSRKRGREVLFAAQPERLADAGEALSAIANGWDSTLAQLKRIAEQD